MNNERIEINPQVMMGKPVIRGTRVPVYVILNLLAEGYDAHQVIKEYPDLTIDDILSALRYGAAMTHFEEFESMATV